jgi:hypothetical protein
MRYRALAAFVAVVVFFFVCVAPSRVGAAADPCSDLELTYVAQGSNDIASPCTLSPGAFLVEGLYYQNASKVGGTALAAYPLLQVQAGIVRRVDLVVDAPSQVAESGLAGAGLYPRSHSSYGARYLFARSQSLAFATTFAVSPPASFYSPSETQAKYALAFVSAYTVTPGFLLRAQSQVATSHTVGIGRILPTNALGADLGIDRSTVVSTDIASRVVTARFRAQNFVDVDVKRMLARKLMFDVGVGTSFNAVASSKAHYLAGGLSFRP